MNEFIVQTGIGLFKLLGLVFIIVMPLLILLEIFRHYGLLEKLIGYISPVTRKLGFKNDSVFPVIAGILFGLSYGAGVIIGETQNGRIDSKQAFLIAVYLGLFHAIIEDTLLFTTQGAIWWILLGVRFVAATLITAVIGLYINRKNYEQR
jgi:spore maturation protein SpmB